MSDTPTVYRLGHRNDCEWLVTGNNGDFEALAFDGTPRARFWQPVPVRRMKSLDGNPLRERDFPTGGGQLAMNEAARTLIGPELEALWRDPAAQVRRWKLLDVQRT
jgi:hypothetical protein